MGHLGGLPLLAGNTALQLGGRYSILWFFLLLLFGVLMVLFAMAIGGVVVAGLSLPALIVLPTVRQPLVAIIESLRGVQIESPVSRRFIGVYLLFVYGYGGSLVLFSAMLAESIGTIQWFMSSWQADVLAASVAAISIGAGTVLLVRRYGPERRPRALVEWTVFLGFLDGLILFAAFVVPWAIGGIIIRLIS